MAQRPSIRPFYAYLNDRVVESVLLSQVGCCESVVLADHAGMHGYLIRLIVADGIESLAATGRPRNCSRSLCFGLGTSIVGI